MFDLISAAHQVSTYTQRTFCLPDNILMAVVNGAVSNNSSVTVTFYNLLDWFYVAVIELVILYIYFSLKKFLSFLFLNMNLLGNTNTIQPHSPQMHGKESVNTKYMHSWLSQHCPRLVMWLHRSIVHMLTVGHRTIPDNTEEEEVSHRDYRKN